MNILVTGGTGFIGKALVTRLVEDGNQVVVLTRYKEKAEEIRDLAEIYEADLSDKAMLEMLTPSQSIDVVFHLAASLNYFGNEKLLYDTNVDGTSNLCRWAIKNGVKRFIFTSSIEAMGPTVEEDIPANEDYPSVPVSSYGKSKLEAEKRILEFERRGLLNTIILRLGNVYGPGSSFLILPIVDALLNKNNKLLRFLPIFKDYYLHPLYVGDLIEIMVKIAQRTDNSGVYILSGAKYVTMESLFKIVAGILKVNFTIGKGRRIDRLYLYMRNKYVKFREKSDLIAYLTADAQRIHRAYSIERAKRQLAFSPKIDLEEGIRRTIEWAKGGNPRKPET